MPGSLRVPLRPSPPMPSAAVYQAANYGLTRLTTQDRQKLMAWLYQTNIVTKAIMRQTINPIVGMTGFSYQSPPNTPTCEKILDRYRSFNRLDRRPEQRNIVRQYLNSGEMIELAAPFQDTWYTVRCPSLLVRQTLLDPYNFQEVIGLMLEPDYFSGKTYIYKTITDETRLSPQALAIRSRIEHSCFYWANFEHDEMEDAPGWTITPDFDKFLDGFGVDAQEWIMKQRRGEPFFSTWIDLFNHLVDTLWSMLDRTKSWGAFNYKFQVNTNDPDIVSSMKKVKQWQDAIGTPEMNSAIYIDQNIDVQPMSFPMQSADIKQLLDVMLQVTGMSANAASYDLGANLNTTYATSKSQGSPQENFQIAVQGDVEDMFLDQYRFVLQDAAKKGRIPKQELKQFYD